MRLPLLRNIRSLRGCHLCAPTHGSLAFQLVSLPSAGDGKVLMWEVAPKQRLEGSQGFLVLHHLAQEDQRVLLGPPRQPALSERHPGWGRLGT